MSNPKKALFVDPTTYRRIEKYATLAGRNIENVTCEAIDWWLTVKDDPEPLPKPDVKVSITLNGPRPGKVVQMQARPAVSRA